MDFLAGLNPKQKEAVLETEGPVMVMAGAGSGKTRVLTHRIAHLIADLGIPSSNILAVTFTNKAANEMKERISKLVDINTKYMWVSTFHSFCSRFLRLEINVLPNYTTDFVILDTEDSLKVIKDLLKKYELNDDLKPQILQKWISSAKNFEDFKIPTENPYHQSLFNKIFDLYQEYLEKNNSLDFDDLQIVTVKILKKHPDILLKYQNKFQYILVDEYQDTNYIQFELINLLAIGKQNIFVVGDQDQSIYSFRGAVVENINKFRRVYPLTKLILLEENYRSTKEILALANLVIANNNERIKKNLYTNKEEGTKPLCFHAASAYEEVMFVIDKIKELLVSGYSYKDFAIMYRANYLSRGFEDMLIKYQIPYQIYGGLSFFSRKEVKDMVAYLRLFINEDDNLSFLRVVNEPKRKIGPALISKLDEVSVNNAISLFKAIDEISASGIGYTNLKNFKELILTGKELISNTNMEDLIDFILDNSGYRLMLEQDKEEERLENVLELKSVLKEASEYYEGNNEEKLRSFLADLALRTDTDDAKDDSPRVKLMSFHQAKGLEFPVVFMVAMEEEIFPSSNSYTIKEQEEERRICYVGVTRAMERLYLSYASNRFRFGRQETMLPSRFLKEMHILKKPEKITTTVTKAATNEPKTNNIESFNVGDKINHKAFGDGLVVEVKPGNVIKVAFKVPFGIKTLISTHPSIRKIEK